MTRWYLHRMHGCIALTIERLDDQRGLTTMWPARLAFDARMRRAMRVALGEMAVRLAEIDTPRFSRTFDPVEIGAKHG